MIIVEDGRSVPAPDARCDLAAGMKPEKSAKASAHEAEACAQRRDETPVDTLKDELAALKCLRERAHIQELLAHYARCVDVQDAAGVAAVFCEDGALCNPGMPAVEGRTRIAKLYAKLLPAMRTSSHVVGAQQVQLTGEGEALVHAAFQAWDSYVAPDAPDCLSFGFYEVRARRELDGVWRIAELNINFAGQLEVAEDGGLRLGQGMNGRGCEQFGRPWPPNPRA